MNLDRKQKILIPLIIIVLGILAWQLYSMNEERSSPAPSSMVRGPDQRNPLERGQAVNTSNLPSPVQTTSVASQQQAKPVSEQDKQRLREVSQSDAEYLKLIQEYQLLQVQRRIAEDARAIAVAKLETAKAIAETSKFGGTNFGSGMTGILSQTDGDYKLVFTGQESGQWTATLKINDQLLDVVNGTSLPDGYKVTAVDGDSVTLQKANKQKVISFLGISESQVQTQPENGSSIKDAKAEALLQIIAPAQIKKKQPEVNSTAPIAAKIVPVATAPVVDTKAVTIERPKAPELKVESSAPAKADKSALTAAFLGNESKSNKLLEKLEYKKTVSPADTARLKSAAAPSSPNQEPIKPVASKPSEKNLEIKSAPTAKPIEQKTVVEKPALASAQPQAEKAAVVGNFTVQLMSDREEAAVKSFIKQNKLDEQANYSKTTINGQTWYVLTYGRYATHAEAQAALQQLPKGVLAWKPFVRKLVSSNKKLAHAQHKPVSLQASSKDNSSLVTDATSGIAAH